MNSFYSTEDNGNVHKHHKSEKSKWREKNFFHFQNILNGYNIILNWLHVCCNLLLFTVLLYYCTHHVTWPLNTQPFKVTSHQWMLSLFLHHVTHDLDKLIRVKDEYCYDLVILPRYTRAANWWVDMDLCMFSFQHDHSLHQLQ